MPSFVRSAFASHSGHLTMLGLASGFLSDGQATDEWNCERTLDGGTIRNGEWGFTLQVTKAAFQVARDFRPALDGGARLSRPMRWMRISSCCAQRPASPDEHLMFLRVYCVELQ